MVFEHAVKSVLFFYFLVLVLLEIAIKRSFFMNFLVLVLHLAKVLIRRLCSFAARPLIAFFFTSMVWRPCHTKASVRYVYIFNFGMLLHGAGVWPCRF